MIDNTHVLREAWRIWWRHKRLWLLGFAASLGLIGLRTGLAGRSVWERAAGELPPDVGDAFVRFLDSPYLPVVTVLAGLLLLAGVFGLAVLNAVGRASLVDQVRAAEERGSVSLRDGWAAGKRQLWPVLLLRVILGLPSLLGTVASAMLLALGMLAAPGSASRPIGAGLQPGIILGIAIATLCLTPTVGFLVLLSVPLNVLLRLAVRARVLEGLEVRVSMRRAWLTARQHWATIFVLWVVQVAVTLVGLILLGLPLLMAAGALSAAAVAVGFVSLLWSMGLTALVGLIGWLAAGAVGGVIETFVSAMWTLAYREMHGLGLTGEGVQVSG